MVDVSALIEEHNKEIKKKTMNVKEFAREYGIGLSKAYQLANAQGFPCIKNGNRIIIIRSKVDEFIENNIGLVF